VSTVRNGEEGPAKKKKNKKYGGAERKTIVRTGSRIRDLDAR